MACGYCPVNIKPFPKNNNIVNINVYPKTTHMYDNALLNEKQCDQDVHCLNNNVELMDANNIDRVVDMPEGANVNMAPNNPYTIMPPPPHKICNKNIMILNYHKKDNWKVPNGNGRSLSPIGYESDESSQSYCSQGNMPDENGLKNKMPRNEFCLYDQTIMFGKYSHSSPNMFFHSSNLPPQLQQQNANGNFHKRSRYSNTRLKHESRKPVEIERRVYGLMERFTSRAKLFEITPNPKDLTNGGPWDELNCAIWEVYSSKAQRAETYIKKLELWQSVYLLIRKVIHRYGLFMVGSTMSSLATEDSDIDMCLLVKPCLPDSRTDAVTNLEQIRDILENSDFVVDPHVILAKVPILKFKGAKNGFEVDLNCNNAVGIRNTHMLHCYTQLDWRVRPLVIIVKIWAQLNNINDAKNMTISSYSLALMVIHYLQCGITPPVVPCLHGLHPNKFSPTSEIQRIDIQEELPDFKSDNKMSLSELLIGFLQYYTYFNYNMFAISVRTGSRLPIDECRYARSVKNDPHQWKFLCIEEPFDLSNTARSVYDPMQFKRIRNVFHKSYKILVRERNLSGILCDIEKSNQR